MSAPSGRVIVTADDFGLHPAVNEAVAHAHDAGILSATSLMVGAEAAPEAVALARARPALGVGLHLVLTDGRAVLPRSVVPDLVDANGRFHDGMARAGARFFFQPRVRRQLAAEIRAQYEAFAATGLVLDHVNAHKHFHVHPTILSLALRIGGEYGLRAMRWPHEPRQDAGQPGSGSWRTAVETTLMAPWLQHMRRRMTASGVVSNARLLGLRATGHMTEARVLTAIAAARGGAVAEIYCHPASRDRLTPAMADYDHRGEYAALISPRVLQAMQRAGLQPTRFAEIADTDRLSGPMKNPT
ncbi:hopanoid biosynthesis-associated protein HpnK [Salinisphaera sp. LB1]|uniref:hopanoid biosynthesis-associated protein HpnK n=1 Tax=Salinisphaera sp. LB1 TaxID=2183911 RepID=UPI000D708791|nr:hopanoid biosynthesis-associated protein HpnK [Salinisphaera sp. LB1]AWN14533.1 cellobiose phosphotransferase system celC [Salinisphaera sp. LB1]